MNEWPAAIWASISAMTAALVLSFIVVLGSFARQSSAIQQEDDNAVALVKEYRHYSLFNGTKNLYPQDVISAIAESRGTPEIWVDTQDGSGVAWEKWTSSSLVGDFDSGTLPLRTIGSAPAPAPLVFPNNKKFDASLVADVNGEITRIEFRRP